MNTINFTQILNLARQRHNFNQFHAPDEQADKKACVDILQELGINASELLYKIGCIESAADELSNGEPLDDYRKREIYGACRELRYIFESLTPTDE